MHVKRLRTFLVAACAAALLLAGSVTTASGASPPWCGTPSRGPDSCATRRQLADPPGRQLPAHPVVRDSRCTLADIQARSNGRMDVEVIGQSALGRDLYLVTINALDTNQQRKDFQTWQNIRKIALDRARSRAGDAREGRRRREGADLHPVGDPRERVRGSRRDVRPRRARRDDAVRHRPRGRRDPRPRRSSLSNVDPEPGRAHREPARERQQLRPEPRLPDAVAVRDQGLGLDHAGVAAAGHARPARLRHSDADRVDDEAAQPEHRLRPLAEVEPVAIDANEAAHERRSASASRGRSSTGARTAARRRRAASAPTAIRPGLRRPRAGTTGARSIRRCTHSSSA